MLPETRGLGKVPPAKTAARVKPSGEMLAFVMGRSVTGPTAANAPTDNARVTKTERVEKEIL